MAKKQFKAESKRLLDLMVNSIYTHKEIFLRELISNASDAEDKLAYKSLTDDTVEVKRKDLKITIVPDKQMRTLTISDNGIGMSKEDLESNLGTIARSGSGQFKAGLAEDDKAADKIDVIGSSAWAFTPPSWWPIRSPLSPVPGGARRPGCGSLTGPTAIL